MNKVLITGGTGSFGTAMVNRIIKHNLAEKIIVFSRDELKQFEMKEKYPSDRINFMLGDVRDLTRLKEVLNGVDTVIHAAAMKHISASENNPMEAIKTNIIGADNIVTACIDTGVERVIALSTDKAANPANLYGATKLCSDKLIIGGNFSQKNKKLKLSVVRYGNVIGSRGSVIPFFKEKIKTGKIPITDLEMTRFWLTLEDGVEFVLNSLDRMLGGEIFVPKIPSFKVLDVAKLMAPNAKIEIIGIRTGEKLHEIMITEDDYLNTLEFKDFYVILSPHLLQSTYYHTNGIRVKPGFSYASNTNKYWYTSESFKSILIQNNFL